MPKQLVSLSLSPQKKMCTGHYLPFQTAEVPVMPSLCHQIAPPHLHWVPHHGDAEPIRAAGGGEGGLQRHPCHLRPEFNWRTVPLPIHLKRLQENILSAWAVWRPESLTAGPVCKATMTLGSGPSSKHPSEGEARPSLLTSGNQNRKLKLASWGQKPGKIFGNTEIRLGKDAEGKCFGCFQTSEDD